MSNDHYENLTDLNALALKEFRLLVSQNKDLDIEWKQEILQITENGIPQDLESLSSLIKGDANDKTQTG